MEREEQSYSQSKRTPCIRELTLSNGIQYPCDEELIMLLLGSGTRDTPVEKLAQKVLAVIDENSSGNLISELKAIKGMGDSKSLAVAAAVEFGRRRNSFRKVCINNPKDVIPFIQHYSMERREHFICVSLNGAHEIIKIRLVSVGTASRTLVHPREIFCDPVADHASAVICCHNHPFGPCLPSEADRASTKSLQKAADILGIAFLDHIIITANAYFSFLEHGML